MGDRPFGGGPDEGVAQQAPVRPENNQARARLVGGLEDPE